MSHIHDFWGMSSLLEKHMAYDGPGLLRTILTVPSKLASSFPGDKVRNMSNKFGGVRRSGYQIQ